MVVGDRKIDCLNCTLPYSAVATASLGGLGVQAFDDIPFEVLYDPDAENSGTFVEASYIDILKVKGAKADSIKVTFDIEGVFSEGPHAALEFIAQTGSAGGLAGR
jgi:hypothetical protein